MKKSKLKLKMLAEKKEDEVIVNYYFRKGRTYTPNEVLSKICQEDVDFDGDKIWMGSDRYKTFNKSLTCIDCGITGIYFAKERSLGQDVYHFNLYAIDENGNEVLMTKDHILPKSKGGADHIDNYQTMCTKCNSKKGDKIIKEAN